MELFFDKRVRKTTPLHLVLLSGHDSKKYQGALRLKKEIAENPDKYILPEKAYEDNREIDGFGETTTTCVHQTQKRLTPDEVKMLIVDYQSGKTPTELAEKYGCHRITVGKILKRNGVEIRQSAPSQAKQNDAIVVAGYQSGKSTYFLAEEFGCDRGTISRILREHNIDVNNRKAQNKLDSEKVIGMYTQMYTTKEIAKQFEVSPKAILKCLRDNGVKIRNRWDYYK